MEPRSSIAMVVFSLATLFFLFSLLVALLRWRSWCTCDVCKTYLSSSWADEGFTNLVDWYAHLLRLSPTRTVHVHVHGNIITANPANVERMLKTGFDNYPKGERFSSILGDLLGRGIFAVDGHSWLFQRKMASLELGSVSVRSYAFQIISSELRHRLIPLLASVSSSPRSVVDLQDLLRRFSFDTICKISFDVDPRCLELDRELSEFVLAFDRASSLSASRALSVCPLVWKIKRFFNLGSERELRRNLLSINALANEVIRVKRKSNGPPGKDLLSRFLSSTDDERLLRDIVISFLLAGRDTVASGLTSFFFLLSRNQRVECKIVEEIEMVGGVEEEKTASLEQLGKMRYLHAALHESLRLYPPVQFDSRFAQEDDFLPDGSFVRKGTRLTYHAYAMGRMTEIWGEDCLEFRPERWLDRDGNFLPQSPLKYTVFHAGARICPGRELAVMEMKSVAAAVVSRFRAEVLIEESELRFTSGLTASVLGGLPVAIRARRPPTEV